MEKHILDQKLYIIAFEITTPLVSLGGFCNLAKNRTKSQHALNHLMSMMETIEKIKAKKDSLLDKTRLKTDINFNSNVKAAKYLRKFASDLHKHEDLIKASSNQLLDVSWEDEDSSYDKWSKNFLPKATKDLINKLNALRNIQPDLELVISENKDK